MAGPELAIGSASILSCALLAAATGAYALASTAHTMVAFRKGYPDRWSAATSTVALASLAWALWSWGPTQIPAPLAPALLGVLVAGAILAPAFMVWGLQRNLDGLQARVPTWMRLRLPILGAEDRRKVPHLLMGLNLLVFLFLGHFMLLALSWFGPSDPSPGEGWGNVARLAEGSWLAAGQVMGAWFLLFLLYVLLPVELLRLRFPARDYPFRRIIESRLREREQGLFGAHLYIAVGAGLAIVLLGRDPWLWPVTVPAAMAVLAVTVFADAASALVGIRWGRRRWFHNPGKTYVGTAGGALVALVLAIPLVGPLAGVLAAVLFVTIDALAPKPIPISDNLLNPILLAALFWVLRNQLSPMLVFP